MRQPSQHKHPAPAIKRRRRASEQDAAPARPAAALRGAPAGPAELLGLQPAIGNAAVARAIAGGAIQRKAKKKKSPFSTTIGAPKRETYSVEAKTLREANDVISAREEAGETTWDPRHKLTLDEDGLVTGAHITVGVTITMPSWPGARKLKRPARDEWGRAYRALEEHEQGHVRIVREQMEGVAERMIGLSEEEANAVFDAAVQRLQEASDAFDKGNDHGRGAGTEINLDVEPLPEGEGE